MRRDDLREIKADVFDLADRIREVDGEYRLFYNLDRARYEVHKRGEIAITWQQPLSAAILVKLRETHVRRRRELLAEIEKQEEAARRAEESRTRERIGQMTERYLSSGRID